MKTFDEDLAKNYAMNDIGLTEEEADDAVDMFGSSLEEYRCCEDCGDILTEKNCKDEFMDDYCTKCWNESQGELKRFGIV